MRLEAFLVDLGDELTSRPLTVTLGQSRAEKLRTNADRLERRIADMEAGRDA